MLGSKESDDLMRLTEDDLGLLSRQAPVDTERTRLIKTGLDTTI